MPRRLQKHDLYIYSAMIGVFTWEAGFVNKALQPTSRCTDSHKWIFHITEERTHDTPFLHVTFTTFIPSETFGGVIPTCT